MNLRVLAEEQQQQKQLSVARFLERVSARVGFGQKGYRSRLAHERYSDDGCCYSFPETPVHDGTRCMNLALWNLWRTTYVELI